MWTRERLFDFSIGASSPDYFALRVGSLFARGVIIVPFLLCLLFLPTAFVRLLFLHFVDHSFCGLSPWTAV